MPTYIPTTFAPEYHTPEGERLWLWLNKYGLALETASRMNRPAVEGVATIIDQEFPTLFVGRPKEEFDRVKQMTGHMVRQIMEARGHVMTDSARVLSGEVFKWGKRYKVQYKRESPSAPKDIE